LTAEEGGDEKMFARKEWMMPQTTRNLESKSVMVSVAQLSYLFTAFVSRFLTWK
jgi:hypothetical protein